MNTEFITTLMRLCKQETFFPFYSNVTFSGFDFDSYNNYIILMKQSAIIYYHKH